MKNGFVKMRAVVSAVCFSFFFLQGQDVLSGPAGQPGDTGQEFSFQVDASSRIFSKVKSLFLCLGNDDMLLRVGKLIKGDLEITDQLDIDLKVAEQEPQPAVLPKLFEKGTSLCLFLKETGRHGKARDMMLTVKEPSSQSVVFEKKFACHDKDLVLVGHRIAAEVLSVLTGQTAPLLATLVYSKQVGPHAKVLCASDVGGKIARLLFQSRTVNVAPRVHTKAPMIFFSQFTRSNTRLMSYDFKTGKCRVVCSYDGLNMQPSFSQNGIQSVLCLSPAGNSELFLYDQKESNAAGRRVFTQLTNNKGNNASPCFLPNEDVIFCSDFETGTPQIYYLDRKKNVTRRLTNGSGYCAAPSYCALNNSIVYCRLIQGYFQLCVMCLDGGKHVERQLTTSPGDKQEPAWSPDGKFVACSYDCADPVSKMRTSQIALLNMDSKKMKIVTSGKESKSFPCWVPDPWFV